MRKFNENFQSEEGNVLFLILIAVALFAALSYAVTQSGGSGSGSAGEETNLIRGAQLTQYPSNVKQAVTRMLIGGGIAKQDIVFDPPSNFSTDLDTDTKKSEAVFHPNGGGAPFQKEAKLGSDVVAGEWKYVGTEAVKNLGTNKPELMMFAAKIPTGICQSVNDRVGLPTDFTATEVDAGIDYESMTTIEYDSSGSVTGDELTTGTVTASEQIGNSATALANQRFGCTTAKNDGVDNDLIYFQVLATQ